MTSMFTILLQYRGGGTKYTAPYDSTQGVPDYIFIIFWMILIAFGIRLAWEYRDKLFVKKRNERTSQTKTEKK